MSADSNQEYFADDPRHWYASRFRKKPVTPRKVNTRTTGISDLRSLIPLLAAVAGLALLLCTDGHARAQTADDRPSLSAVRIADAPKLDGVISGDPAWSGIPASSGFTQTTPDAGQPASLPTEIRVAYTSDTLYIGIICHDDLFGEIVVSDTRRDASLQESDSLTLILDTYLDGQNGFVFGTNPSGLQYDGQLTREGAGGDRRSGSGGGFNVNWDGVWEVETQVRETGWSAEFAIPFTTLRYPDDAVQSWGFNVQRNIRRRNENAFWAPLERQFSLYRVSDAGRLESLEVPAQRNFKFVPYGRLAYSDVGAAGSNSDFESGFDIKYSITPSLTLDLTYNTDFAQVEVDEVQINLDRFNLFFPEKRPFFLENAGQFSVGNPGSVEMFFSRRIGISEDGDVIPIEGGVRLSGKVDRTNVGFLYMQTEDLGGAVPADDFIVARVNQDLPNRSSLGAIFVNRESTGALALPDNENQTFGVDGRWGIGEYGLISGFAAKTSTPGLRGNDRAFSLKGDYDTEDWSFGLGYTEVGESFNPEVGFLRRDAYQHWSTSLLYRYRPQNNRFGLHELRPHYSYNLYHDLDGFKESAFLHVDNHFEWKSGAEIHTGINFVYEGLLEPFEISDGIFVPAGSYDNSELSLVAFTDRGAPLSISMRTTIGGFFNGDRVQLSPTIYWRHGENFTSQWSWTRNDVELPTGDFVTNLGRIRLSYSLSSKSTLQALFQYNNVDETWSTNLRYSWLRTANTGLFIVYNDTRGFSGFDGEQPNRSILIKYSHLFEVF
jgi:hypothetical protein